MARPPKRAGHDEKRKGLLPGLVSRVLFQLRIGFDLSLRDREEHPERRVKDRLGVPRPRGELAEANQILPALALRRELIQTLLENRVAHLLLSEAGSEWLGWREYTGADQIDIRYCSSRVAELVARFGPNQVHLAEAEPGIVVPVVTSYVIGV